MQIQSELGQTGYDYDPLNRLSKAEPDQALQTLGLPQEAYSWDAAGNRLSSAHQAGAWTYNEANQLLQYPRALDENAPAQQSQTEQVSASYNALGHLIKETGAGWERNWRYNAAGRLSEIKDGASDLTVQYRYDPFGRRIAKTVTQGATSRTTYYINGESALMAEADEEGRITRAYGFNPHTQQARTNEEDEDAQESSLWSTDPIWQADLAAGQSLKDASYHYLVTDHLGTPVLALNKAGEATWKANYEAFGKAIINPASTAQINLRLPGQYFDAETGLHQNWNRDYAPGIGRYVQADPIGLAGGLNRYVYAVNNPLIFKDPRGLIIVFDKNAKIYARAREAFANIKRSSKGRELIELLEKSSKRFLIKDASSCTEIGGGAYVNFNSGVVFININVNAKVIFKLPDGSIKKQRMSAYLHWHMN
mgnify:CR=1 FL=1